MHSALSTFRRLAALELRRAASLRHDMAVGRLPRRPAISAIRDSLHQARALTVSAQLVGRV